MRILAILLQGLASLMRLLPVKARITFLSRQSSTLSLDFKLLISELNSQLPSSSIALCLTEPETKSKSAFSFAFNTIKQLYYANTSKVVIIDGYVPAVSIPKKYSKTTVIQLWHSLGAIKKFGYQCLDTPAGRSSQDARAAHMHENYDFIIAGGPGAVSAFAEAFNCSENQIIPLGLPRIDYLLDPNLNSSRRQKAHKLSRLYPFLVNESKNILYAPTLRKGAGYDNWLTNAVSHLNERCASEFGNEYNLIITGHPLDFGFDQTLLDRYPQLHFLSGVPTIDLLEFADEVISDYSGIIFEAGILGKPLSYYLPDFEQYKKSPGINIDPRELNTQSIEQYLGHPSHGTTAKLSAFILKHLND